MSKSQFGMVGLGTMGRNFLLNVADSGFSCVGYDLDAEKRNLLLEEGKDWDISAAEDPSDLVSKLAAPRTIMLLVPAGKVVDAVIEDLLTHLEKGDLIIDGGNSHFTDTERREAYLAAKGFGFLGVGVSGGEEGARLGPSIMPGGSREYYARVAPIFEAVAAKVDGEPCVAYMGSGSAGHFVKMVHNGIEYAMMQLIAEAYNLLRNAESAGGLDGSEGVDLKVADIFADWNKGKLNSFLIEITATVLKKIDGETGKPLVEMILDTAGQKGTGKWTSQAAMDLGIPIPTIDSAVSMRQISAQKALRVELARRYASGRSINNSQFIINNLHNALYAAFIVAYAQGLSLLQAASEEKNYGLNLDEIAKIWRGGCIIRSAMLEDIRSAFSADRALPNLLLDPKFAGEIGANIPAFRAVVEQFISAGIPAMCFSSALAYIDAFSSERLPANLTQAQRDYFGAHTYQRIDKDGIFHTQEWES
ncbi:MAG: NADP-dependent phosphogluconate dehydrogenase [Acidobacteria bacterium]|nr:NADP-dependent phosphogluconate dehydrogenase [Acidobacteriota bacterium]